MAEKKRPAKGKPTAKRPVAKATKATTAGGRTAKADTTARPSATAPPSKTGSVVEQLGPRLRAELEAVEKSEAKILKGLADERIAAEFVHDPAAALRRMKVDLPPIMAARLKNPEPFGALVAPRSYQLPNGQVVTARVKVRFTAGAPGRHDGQER